MKFKNWKLEDLIDYLKRIKSSPDRLDCHCVARVSGEIFVKNGEPKSSIDTERKEERK